MDFDDVKEKVDTAITTLVGDFESCPHKYLTEDDVRFHLCHLLLENFGEVGTTADGGHSISLHTEVRWWGLFNRKTRSDIVIFDLASLYVTNKEITRLRSLKRIPDKGFGADHPICVIEIKLRRFNRYSNTHFSNNIQADIDKLIELSDEFKDKDIVWRVVAFDKKDVLRTNTFRDPKNFLCYKYASED